MDLLTWLPHITSVSLGTLKTFPWYMLCCIMQIARMLTHHGQYSSRREMAVWAGCWQWVGKSWEELEGSFRNNTHVQVKRMKTHAWVGVHTKLEQLNTLLKSPGNTLSVTVLSICGWGARPLCKLCRKCSSPSRAQSSQPVNITSAVAGMTQPGSFFS